MQEALVKMAEHLNKTLKSLGFPNTNTGVLLRLINVAYEATIVTEEGRYVKGSITYANPECPELSPPPKLRANYPAFTRFENPIEFNAKSMVKISRAIDSWSGSIAVYGKSKSSLKIWGIVDQLVGENVNRNREARGGFSNPGIVTVKIEGVGHVSSYSGGFFLGKLKGGVFFPVEQNPFYSTQIHRRISPFFGKAVKSIEHATDGKKPYKSIQNMLYYDWVETLARLCIGLRRLETGGAFLISDKPNFKILNISYKLNYKRLRDSMVLLVLDIVYKESIREKYLKCVSEGSIPRKLDAQKKDSDTDEEDRRKELSGAVKLVTSLASADGLVLMTPTLEVLGFGGKINCGTEVMQVYDGSEFLRKGTNARKIDPEQFGTRHGSMFRYCQEDSSAIGLVISQDGQVRVIAAEKRCILMWENVQLLRHNKISAEAITRLNEMRKFRKKVGGVQKRGYSPMPKTYDELLKIRQRRRKGDIQL